MNFGIWKYLGLKSAFHTNRLMSLCLDFLICNMCIKILPSSRRKFIVIINRPPERKYLNLSLPIKELEKEEQTEPKVSRRKEIIKIRAEINERETKGS